MAHDKGEQVIRLSIPSEEKVLLLSLKGSWTHIWFSRSHGLAIHTTHYYVTVAYKANRHSMKDGLRLSSCQILWRYPSSYRTGQAASASVAAAGRG